MNNVKPGQRQFFIIALVIVVLLMTGVLPTPLYRLYVMEFGFSAIAITLIYAAYAVAVVPTLFVFGPLGDKLGRKRVLALSLAIAIASSIVLGIGQGFVILLLGRALQGVAVGAASGNATAALVELEPNKNRRQAGRIAGTSIFVGLAVGPLLSGFVAEYLPAPTLLVYVIDFIILITVFALLATVQEPGSWPKPEPFRLHWPTVPSEIKTVFASVSLAAALVFAMAGLYYSLAPIYTEELLNTTNVLIGGGVASLMVFVSIITQRTLSGVQAKRLIVAGEISLAVGLILIVLAHFVGSILVLMLAAISSGFAFGAAFLGAVTIVNAIAPEGRRGDVTSTFFALAYLALGLPIIALGFVEQIFNLFDAVVVFAAVIFIVSLAHAIWILLYKHDIPG